jgi:(S)-mandelate dehydrogenase
MAWRRRIFRGADVRRALNIADLRERAHRRVPGFVFEYVEGGAEDEATLRRNRAAFDALRFIPQTLVDTSGRRQRITLFGRDTPTPLIIAPTGGNGVLYPRGDFVLARVAARAGIPFCLSTVSCARLEDIATEVGGRLWMQLYVMHERRAAADIVARADAAGYEALVLTSDAQVFGHREWDRRNYRSPGEPTLRNLIGLARHPRWVFEVLMRHGVPRFENIAPYVPPGAANAVGGSTIIPTLFTPTITWEDIAWLRRIWSRKLLLKGVLSRADAERAAALGCDGIVLTNHGGRQLDHCVAPIEMLPEIAAAVGDRMTIIIDSGFRRGTDVIKALALGAHAVMIGRPTLYGLAAGGERGAWRALEILMTEIDRTLGLLGRCSVSELGPQILHQD